MKIDVIIHTESQEKLKKLFKNLNKKLKKKDVNLFLHCKNYIPWNDEELRNEITSFSSFAAFPTTKEGPSSIVDLLLKAKGDNILIIDEDGTNIEIESWNEKNTDYLYCKKNEILSLNFDTKYQKIKWFLIDLLTQKGNVSLYNDNTEDYRRYNKKIDSPLFNEKIIYIDGGLGDHIMALPLLEKVSKDVYVCCKYQFVYEHLPVKGFVHWNDELFGGYERFVYQYGSTNNSKTIVDAFFGIYGYKRTNDDVLIYNGKRDYNQEIQTDKKIVLICTSAAKIQDLDSNKDWNDIRWLKLVNKLQKDGYYVIQVGTKKDNQIFNVDLKFLDKPLSNLASLVDMSDLWISVDTFFHHFASAIKPNVGICLTPFYNDHAKHPGVTYIEKNCGKNFSDRKWWLDLQQPERKECMDLISVEDVIKIIDSKK